MTTDPMDTGHTLGAGTELYQFAQGLFAFLVEDKGFATRRTRKTWFSTTYTYVAVPKGLGLEIGLDFRDEAIDVYLVRLLGRKLPEPGIVYVGDQRVRIFLRDALRDVMHVHDEELERSERFQAQETRRGYDYSVTVLRAWRDIIERHIDDVLRQPPDLLFPQRPA